MNLYKVWVERNYCSAHDTYDSMVVCAPDILTARKMHPSGGFIDDEKNKFDDGWKAFEDTSAVLIGRAFDGVPIGPIVSSFNAG